MIPLSIIILAIITISSSSASATWLSASYSALSIVSTQQHLQHHSTQHPWSVTMVLLLLLLLLLVLMIILSCCSWLSCCLLLLLIHVTILTSNYSSAESFLASYYIMYPQHLLLLMIMLLLLPWPHVLEKSPLSVVSASSWWPCISSWSAPSTSTSALSSMISDTHPQNDDTQLVSFFPKLLSYSVHHHGHLQKWPYCTHALCSCYY